MFFRFAGIGKPLLVAVPQQEDLNFHLSSYIKAYLSDLGCLGSKVELQTSLTKKIFTVIILHGIICIIHVEYACIIN